MLYGRDARGPKGVGFSAVVTLAVGLDAIGRRGEKNKRFSFARRLLEEKVGGLVNLKWKSVREEDPF